MERRNQTLKRSVILLPLAILCALLANGATEVALGVAGIEPLLDLRGRRDLNGHELLHTTMAIADDVACAAGLVMLKDSRIAAAIIRGAPVTAGPGGGWRFVRPRESDLFR